MAYVNARLELDALFSAALEKNASDIHLTVGRAPILRVDGRLLELTDLGVLDPDHASGLVFGMMSDAQRTRYETERQIDFSVDHRNITRLRVNAFFERNFPSAALRIVPAQIPRLEDLNLPANLQIFTQLKTGLVLFVSPTGNGKSTSMAALIRQINATREEHIVTIEDPIEFIHQNDRSFIQQREVGADCRSFSDGIYAILREDANVVLIGEMRDQETMAATLTMAEAGHLVFATLHTFNAAETVNRIIDAFPPYQQSQIRTQLASTLAGVVSQRLIPKIGGGRVPAIEMMIANDAVRNTIRDGKEYQLSNIVDTNIAQGMISMERSLARLVQSSLIEQRIAEAYSKDRDVLMQLLASDTTV